MRNVFFSFDYDDIQRVSIVRNHFITKGGQFAAGYIDKAEWESIARTSDTSIKNWIDRQLNGTSVTVVLIGSSTYLSRWVEYEILESIRLGKGIIGIHINTIRDWTDNFKVSGSVPSNMAGYQIYNWVTNDGYNNFDKWIENAYQQAQRRKISSY